MSHIVNITTRVQDAAALAAACQRLGLEQPTTGTARLFSTQVTGSIVQLPGWTYPIVIDTAHGTVQYDNYNGNWGSRTELDKLLQAYAVEKSRIEARRAGHTLTEKWLSDGSIKLTISVGSGAGGTLAAGGAA